LSPGCLQANELMAIRSVQWLSSALVKDVAQMLPEQKLGAPPHAAICAVRL
jgi:hypothetical protein